MDVSEEEIVYEPRLEKYNTVEKGRTLIYTPNGRYVGETNITGGKKGETRMKFESRVQKPEDQEWIKFLEGQDIVQAGETTIPEFDEGVLGIPDTEDRDDSRENYWMLFDEQDYEIHRPYRSQHPLRRKSIPEPGTALEERIK